MSPRPPTRDLPERKTDEPEDNPLLKKISLHGYDNKFDLRRHLKELCELPTPTIKTQ